MKSLDSGRILLKTSPFFQIAITPRLGGVMSCASDMLQVRVVFLVFEINFAVCYPNSRSMLLIAFCPDMSMNVTSKIMILCEFFELMTGCKNIYFFYTFSDGSFVLIFWSSLLRATR